MRDDDQKLWSRVCATCTPLGEPNAGSAPVSRIVRKRSNDLHGFKTHDAYVFTKESLDDAYNSGKKSLVMVTGRSGDIRKEFPEWMRLDPRIRNIEPLNGDGAFRIRFKK